ncbi:MAG: hypothetical protein H8E40_16455 [Chloroflexi bacterium]|nr:hypothetical protein [Chloroflexota bacterium]MBL7061846.1 hypothetical protein [Dehalococcoidia bacterium]
MDTPVRPGMYEVTKLSSGANITAARLILDGEFDRAAVFGLGGHHAGKDYGGGFCIINDIAVMIEYVRHQYHLERILVMDYDAHCGNGTQDIYYHNPGVLYIDYHQDPRTLYPGTGFIDGVGEGAGRGYTVNVPLPPHTTSKALLAALNAVFSLR